MLVGISGAVSSTIVAAQAAVKCGLNIEFKLPADADPDYQKLGLIGQEDIVYGGWDVVSDSLSKACAVHKVVPPHILNELVDTLDETPIFPAILVERDSAVDQILSKAEDSERNKDVDYSPTIFTKRPLNELVKSLTYDIEGFRKKTGVEKLIVLNLASTEQTAKLGDVHKSIEAFEKGLEDDAEDISTGMLYAYAAIKNGAHFINFTPSVAADIPALIELAEQNKVTICGKDGKTGQTLYKTAIAPMLKHRNLKLTGWYSTNILGNRDGEILNDPRHVETKISSKSGVLSSIMGYDDFEHQVHIHYYPPRGDAKEAWDNVDFNGWFDVPMQMKINWLGDDSILAAPLALDLVRWVSFFADKGETGVLTQLASYFKSPTGIEECDFFKQVEMLKQHVSANYL